MVGRVRIRMGDRSTFGSIIAEATVIRTSWLSALNGTEPGCTGTEQDQDAPVSPYATDLVQPADSFVISKIKDDWTARWEKHRMRMLANGEWADAVRRDGTWSGKL